MGKLEGKVAIISGSGRGIGRAIALKLAAEGANIVVNDLDAEPAQETISQIAGLGASAIACTGNVTEPGFAERFVKTAIDNFGGLDILINNAGYTWDNVIQKMDDAQWQAILDVHLTAPFRILRAAAPFIRSAAKQEAQAGQEVFRKVVNISSIAGTNGNAGQVNYSAAKAGVTGLTRALSKEWGRYKVTVNCVAFGMIKTRLTEAPAGEGSTIEIDGKKIKVGVNADLLEAMERLIPLGRAGSTAEAAGAVYLFCLPESNYISGQVVACGGGLSI